ncbi:DNA-directed RNA polymerase subunit beta' [Candidatus Dojkabacteria bacterium]|nr:DNA-directed RNA polymerase subunit beta' [Candidatus Dojkabacteria bacterium]
MIKDFKALQITVASPQQVMGWSHGEVKKAETINYRTHTAEVDGLMCEKIFGPTKNFECYCGKYKKIRYKGIVCDKCGVEVTHKRVRRERMGHIKLASPVTHVWFSHGVPNKLSLILGVPQKKLETVIYFARYIVTEFDEQGREDAVAKIKADLDSELKGINDDLKAKVKEIEDLYKAQEKEKKSKEKDKKKLEMQLNTLEGKKKKEIAKLKSIFTQKEKTLKDKINEKLNLVKSIKIGITLSEDDVSALSEYDVDFYKIGMGAEAIEELLKKVDLSAEVKNLKEEQAKTKSQTKRAKYIQRLRIIEGMEKNDLDPSWLVLKILPVIPPELRPIIQLPGGRFATSDLNDLYRRVINRNNRLKRLMGLGAPEIILRNEKRMLQEAVDALIDNSHRPGNAVQNSKQQPYKSLSDMLRGKQGRFRQNLLGKRVDYSGRAVIIAGPELSVYQCGLPKTIALELFKPFVIREIIAEGLAPNIKSAKHYFDSKSDNVWDILERVIQDRPVLLNRAPTLHKQGIQAFFPVLTEGNAISVHPMVCKGFNADFDGDQMAVHLPLSDKAIEEVLEKMFADSNLLLLADGSPVIGVQKDMALGVYYLTGENFDQKEKDIRVFATFDRAVGAYERGEIKLRDKVKVLNKAHEFIITTPGRIKFNELLPKEFDYVNEQVGKKHIGKFAAKILRNFDSEKTIDFLDKVETIGFKYATKSGYSTSTEDFKVSDETKKIIAGVEEKEEQLTQDYYNGLLTLAEKKRLIEETWMEAIDKIAEVTWEQYNDPLNPLNAFENSGALPIANPIRQIAGVKGLILDPLGNIVELPLRSNYKEGLPTLEYFVAARGTRKGLADTALKTAESGYLTRKLVDVAQDVITREEDCGSTDGIIIRKEEKRMLGFDERIIGRFAAKNISDPKTGEVFVKAGDEISEEIAAQIAGNENIQEVLVRSVIGCKAVEGVCQKCYGLNLGTQKTVEKGVAVGVIAAQAMGEAATQLTLNTKHLAGRAGTDITQGLPRVAELFEARTPKGKATLAEIGGKVKLVENKDGEVVQIIISDHKKFKKEIEIKSGDKLSFKRSKALKKGEVILTREDGTKVEAEYEGQVKKLDEKTIVLEVDREIEKEYEVNPEDRINVKDKQEVDKGTPLTIGSLAPKELMDLTGIEGTQSYIIDNIQETYGIQGIAINDKHVEIIVRQMLRLARVTQAGDSTYLPGDFVNYIQLEKENKELKKDGKQTIKYTRVLLGITAASLNTESFLSAASFQEQVRVLTDAALVGKVDDLRGLKENVIIGRPVPLGKEMKS